MTPLYLNLTLIDYFHINLSIFRIIPQAIISRWALAIGGKIWWLVWFLMYATYPLSMPISKLLDWILGHKSGTYYKRAQLKEFVSSHAAAAFEKDHNGGLDLGANPDEEIGESSGSETDDGGLPKDERLTNDEVMIIKGALDLTSKTVTHCMTPLDKVFSLAESTRIGPDTLQSILDSGHSRIPLWRDSPQNLVGMLLVKRLNLNFILNGGMASKADIKELPSVPENTPLYTMLNIFQTGHSHMAAITSADQRCIGIITLEDIIEELLQEEIEDEMDIWRREHIRVRKSPSRSSSFRKDGSGHISDTGGNRERRKRARRNREAALGIPASDTEAMGPSRYESSDTEQPHQLRVTRRSMPSASDTEMVNLDL